MNEQNKAMLSRSCWQFLILSSLLLLAFPAVFTKSLWLGQTWLWLIASPLLILLVLYRHRTAAAWSAALARSSPRRRRAVINAQARRKGYGQAQRHRNPLRAA